MEKVNSFEVKQNDGHICDDWEVPAWNASDSDIIAFLKHARLCEYHSRYLEQSDKLLKGALDLVHRESKMPEKLDKSTDLATAANTGSKVYFNPVIKVISLKNTAAAMSI